MNVTITPTLLRGTITPPPSKSQAHRLIIAAALSDGVCRLSNVELSQDIQATLRCMRTLNADASSDGTVIRGCNLVDGFEVPPPEVMDCGESGSTLRFLIPVALAVRGGGIFTGSARLMERPLQPYFQLFGEKGISYKRKDGALTVTGQLPPGTYSLPGDVSSQFFTGLMFALPLLNGGSRISLTSPLESGGYVELTRQVMAQAGVLTQGGSLPGNQTYQPLRQSVEADWSQAAFWYAAHALGSNLLIQGLNPFSDQPDAQVASLYLQLYSSQEEIAIDVSQCPDLFPALALMAAARPGQATHIGGGARLRLKECDRIAAVVEVLTALGVPVEEFPDGVSIIGVMELGGDVEIDCHNDHRIAMMAAIAATRCAMPITLVGAQCVDKSYPGFWADYEALGGRISRF